MAKDQKLKRWPFAILERANNFFGKPRLFSNYNIIYFK
jgi:hypothetical protein